MNSGFSERWDEIASLWERYRVLSVIAGWILGLMTFPILISLFTDLGETLQNLAPEVIGVFVLGAVFQLILDRSATVQRRKELRLQLGSQSNDFALEAARLLRLEGLGYRDDEFLVGVDLISANLAGASLANINLSKAVLVVANFNEADLLFANLQDANLDSANLGETTLAFASFQGADLTEASLQGAFLFESNLQDSNLKEANFQGANLSGANLEGAIDIDTAIFDENTILPNGEKWRDDDETRAYLKRITEGEPDESTE